MDANESRTAHMRLLVEAAGGPAEWSRRYGGSRRQQPQVSQWISDQSPKGIGKRLARDIEAAMGIPNGTLDYPPGLDRPHGHIVSRDETDPAYVRFPLLEGYAGMGPGTFISDYPEVVKDLRVSREWVSQKMPGIPHDVIRVITGRGDSMRGQYNDGDLIFVDTRVKSFDQDSAYCFRWAGRVQVKRLQLIKPGIVRILSKNPDYESIDAEVEEIEIGGRAIAAWTLREF